MRSIAEQSIDELGGTTSVLVRQKKDHIVLDVLLNRLVTTTGAEQQLTMNRICRLVFAHAFAEEAVLWPALRRTLPDGDELTLQVEEEHQEINELVTRLERLSPDDPDRQEVIDRTVELLRQDVRDEEDVLLPRLQEAVDAKELRRLGMLWELVRRTAPTRPHPVVARRPPGNVLAAVPLSVIDRTRDRLDQVALRAPGSVASALSGASRGLARGAGRIEHLGPLKAGERPETRTQESE
jgi:hemerythrin superfamily protein